MDPFEFASEGYKCTVTVIQLLNTNNWWYMSCKPCKKKCEAQPGGGYRCPKCFGTAAVPRYLLSFIGRDDTAEATFFTFDDIARQIVQRECNAVLNPLKMESGLPQKVNDIVSKKFVFSVSLTEESFNSNAKRKYLVNSVLDRSDRRGSALNIGAPQLPAPAAPATLPEVLPDTSRGLPQLMLPTTPSILPVPSQDTQATQASPATPQASTPPPLCDPDDTPLKNLKSAKSTAPTETRRNLFGPNSDAVQVSGVPQDATQDPPEHLKRPKSKRAKTTVSKDSAKDGSRDTLSAATEE